MKKELDFIEFLKEELKNRKDQNPHYSMRAFSRDLDISSGTLSHFMNRKRALSQENLLKIMDRLGLSEEEKGQFSQYELKKFSPLEREIFYATCSWLSDAILEMTRLKNFESSTENIAKRLNISIEEAQEAVDSLFKYDLLKEVKGRWIDSSGDNLYYESEETNKVLQQLQITILTKAIKAIQEVPKNERIQSSMTMAINKKDIPELRKKIKEFNQSLCEFAQRPSREADEVYQLAVSFFPLT